MSATPALARGWGGWGGHGRHHGDRIDTGDIFAGVLILGGIAAIASAASKADKQKREARERAEPYPQPDPRYDNRDTRPQWNDRSSGSNSGGNTANGGINEAVDRCVGEVERGDTRVETVDSAARDGDGWRVTGKAGGDDFSCSIDREGRIRALQVAGRTAQVDDDNDAIGDEAEPAELVG